MLSVTVTATQDLAMQIDAATVYGTTLATKERREDRDFRDFSR
jgi:hypothetical protein